MDLCSASYGTAGAKWLRQSFFCFYGYIGGSNIGDYPGSRDHAGRTDRISKNRQHELQYAENFTVDYYEDGYKMLTTLPDSQRYLLVPEGQPVPQGLDEDVSILQEPLQNIYLVASGVMDMFASVDAVDQIRFSGQKQENWYIQKAQDAMAEGLWFMPENTANRIMSFWCPKGVIWLSRTG